MKTPDKIYVRLTAFETPWPPYVDENANHGGVEYIRTDKMLEVLESFSNPTTKLFVQSIVESLNEIKKPTLTPNAV